MALAAALLLGLAGPAAAQQGTTPQTAPPEVMPGTQGPASGGANSTTEEGSGSLSDKLSRSEGVIAPPQGGAATDPGIVKPAPDQGGSMVVVPPPGAPGGDPNVRPK